MAGLLGAAEAGQEDEEGGLSEGALLVGGKPAGQAIGSSGLLVQDPQAQTIFERLADNVAFGPENLGLSRPDITSRVKECLGQVGLEDLQWHRSTAHLSGGQAQRLALAGVLAMRPGLLLLDEPTSMIDPPGSGDLVEAVSQVMERTHPTMVLVEHKADLWLPLIDRVIVLAPGPDERDPSSSRVTRVVADGSPEQVFKGQADLVESLGLWIPRLYRSSSSSASDHPADLQVDRTAHQSQAEGRTASSRPLLSVRNLAVGHTDEPIARGITMDFYPGQITALVGRNGSGKSTLALTLAGLLQPRSGRVTAGEDLRGRKDSVRPQDWSSPALAGRIQYVFQNPEYQFVTASVLSELVQSLRTADGRPGRSGKDPSESEIRQARDLMDTYRLDGLEEANPYTLSGGQKRRLTVASALAASPRVLILDEPTFGQDRAAWLSLVSTIRRLALEGLCLIVVTHDEDFLKAVGARIVRFEEETDSGRGEMQIKVSPDSQRKEDKKQSSPSALISSLNPGFRLLGAIILCLIMVISLDLVSAAVACVLSIGGLLLCGYRWSQIMKKSWIIWLGSLASAISVALYGQASGRVFLHWGIMEVSQGSLLLAAATSLRIIAMGVPAFCLVIGIEPTDLADSFSQCFHMPDRFVYGGLAGMRLFSLLQDDWASLSMSRRSRGVQSRSKVGDFLSQSFALLVLSIRRSSNLATAMQARGFGGPRERTHWRESRGLLKDGLYLLICILIPAIALMAAAWAGTFRFLGHTAA